MSRQADPWDAMVQNDDSDEDYIPIGPDGIDDDDQDFEQQDDDYEDTDEYGPSDDSEPGDAADIALSLCILGFSCAASAECGTGCFAQTSNSETESPMLQLWLHCRNSSPVGRVRER